MSGSLNSETSAKPEVALLLTGFNQAAAAGGKVDRVYAWHSSSIIARLASDVSIDPLAHLYNSWDGIEC